MENTTDNIPHSSSETMPLQPTPGTSNEFCSSCHNEFEVQDEIFGVQQLPNIDEEESLINASGDSQRDQTERVMALEGAQLKRRIHRLIRNKILH